MSDASVVFLSLCLFALGPLIVGWYRQMWRVLEPGFGAVLGKPGHFLSEASSPAILLLVAPAGPVIAVIAISGRWDAIGLGAQQAGEMRLLLVLGLLLYVTGLAGLVLSGRAQTRAAGGWLAVGACGVLVSAGLIAISAT